MVRVVYFPPFQGPVEGPTFSTEAAAVVWARTLPFGTTWELVPAADPVPLIVGKFGKKAAVFDPSVKHFGDLAHKYKLAAPPGFFRVDWSRKVDPTKLGTLLNTKLGDCACASKGHDIQLWTSWTGQQAVIPDADMLKMYIAISGYNGTPQSDVGATILSALQYWKAHGIAGHKLDGYAQVAAGDINEVKSCIWTFGNCDVGLQLPNTCLSQRIWRYVSSYGDGMPGSAGGHDVNIIGYDDHAQLLFFMTWGHLKQMSYKFFEVYCDEAWALVSQEWLLKTNHLTPSDVSWTGLLADL